MSKISILGRVIASVWYTIAAWAAPVVTANIAALTSGVVKILSLNEPHKFKFVNDSFAYTPAGANLGSAIATYLILEI